MNDTKLVKAKVGIGGLGPGVIGELPTKLADMAIKHGFAEDHSKLSSRVPDVVDGGDTVLGVAEVPPRFRPGTDEEVAAASAAGGHDAGTLPE